MQEETLEEEASAAASGDVQKRKPNPIWDVLVEIFGPPQDRFKSHFGLVVKELRLLVIEVGIRDAEEAKAEVRRRREALAGEWGVGKATKDALVRHWRLAGELADQGIAGGLTAEQIFAQALDNENERREQDDDRSS